MTDACIQGKSMTDTCIHSSGHLVMFDFKRLEHVLLVDNNTFPKLVSIFPTLHFEHKKVHALS